MDRFPEEREFDLTRHPVAGRVDVDGIEAIWRRNPWGDGFWLAVGERTIHILTEPDPDKIRVAVYAYDQGLEAGRGRGAAQVKAEVAKAIGATIWPGASPDAPVIAPR